MSETTQEPMTNVDASASAMTEETQEMLAASIADDITKVFNSAFQQLTAIRDLAYANATEALEHESEALAKEHGQLEEGIRAIEAVLPSKERLTQHEVDELLLSGKPDAKQDAANKLAELKELQHQPAAMREQQKGIIAKLEAIQAEKHSITRDIFNAWHSECQYVVRSAERALFCTLLDGLQESFAQFQARVGMGTSDNRQRPLLNQGHLSNLTSDGRSAEWAAGHKWYG